VGPNAWNEGISQSFFIFYSYTFHKWRTVLSYKKKMQTLIILFYFFVIISNWKKNINNAERNQHRTKFTNFGSSRKDNRRKNWQRERKLIFYCKKLKITKKRKQVASHHSRESLSFWNHTKDYHFITIYLILTYSLH
jgi:hypothetical protein